MFLLQTRVFHTWASPLNLQESGSQLQQQLLIKLKIAPTAIILVSYFASDSVIEIYLISLQHFPS